MAKETCLKGKETYMYGKTDLFRRIEEPDAAGAEGRDLIETAVHQL